MKSSIFQQSRPLPERYWLAGATVPAALLEADDAQRLPPALHAGAAGRRVAIAVEAGRIVALQAEPPPDAAAQGWPVLDLDDSLVWSAFVEPHAHLDKGDLLAMGLPLERRLFDAIASTRADYVRWTEDELQARADFALRSAFAQGVRALNTYVDWPVPRPQDAPPARGGSGLAEPMASWSVFESLREAWRGRIELVLSSLVTIDAFEEGLVAEAIARRVAATGGVLGVFVYPAPHVPALIPRVFEAAARHSLAVDFHVDEHLEPATANLGPLLAAARASGMGARTTCGHLCVLQRLPLAERDRLLDEAAQLGVCFVSLPATNLHLQDSRQEPPWATPRERGILPVHEARQRGIPVAFGADNHRDPFHPAGDLDPLHSLSLAAAVGQLDDPALSWADAVTRTPAAILGQSWDGVLRVGAPADLVLHPARTSTEWAARPMADRRVIRRGAALSATEAQRPDFRELDAWRDRRRADAPARPPTVMR